MIIGNEEVINVWKETVIAYFDIGLIMPADERHKEDVNISGLAWTVLNLADER
jgi:hypothetical protein